MWTVRESGIAKHEPCIILVLRYNIGPTWCIFNKMRGL